MHVSRAPWWTQCLCSPGVDAVPLQIQGGHSAIVAMPCNAAGLPPAMLHPHSLSDSFFCVGNDRVVNCEPPAVHHRLQVLKPGA